ncbi:hypothetical protein ASPZODRAFT_166461 [Penicilliopsis zonata CBS 506.65]|uniref:Uncharacterized protein n=1 Tax=Penicilliopsis zonata CBS 506.65 TaxID=1073090 RepID=A0A1L9SJ30_9EURO|nr:hypothetical protein ASPZODRAFT_166461 [Penicilliopsis zonata CBS 506.65]OJJ47239.1 hypothetical protein ASPZODRAFT_166461 [Penicilliopsis zonata CBS 506.65]
MANTAITPSYMLSQISFIPEVSKTQLSPVPKVQDVDIRPEDSNCDDALADRGSWHSIRAMEADAGGSQSALSPATVQAVCCQGDGLAQVCKGTYQVHPVYKTYLCFYSAISYEILGRAAHKYSSNKLPLLRLAQDYFLSCSSVLPSAIPVLEAADDSDSPPSSSTDASSLSCFSASVSGSGSSSSDGSTEQLVNDLTRIIERSLSCTMDDPFVSPQKMHPSRTVVIPVDPERKALQPSPLKIRKSTNSLRRVAQLAVATTSPAPLAPISASRLNVGGSRARRPPPLPIKIVPCSTPQKTQSVAASTSEHTPEQTKSVQLYNSCIESLRGQVTASIASVQRLIGETDELQRLRRMATPNRSTSFWSFSPIKDEASREEVKPLPCGQETMEQRIARLRAEEWQTVGLRSRQRAWKGAEYYKAFCSMVLDELYLE